MEYSYTLTDFQQIQCANRVEYVSDIPNYLIEKGVKLYIVYNSFSKNYILHLSICHHFTTDKKFEFPHFLTICHPKSSNSKYSNSVNCCDYPF